MIPTRSGLAAARGQAAVAVGYWTALWLDGLDRGEHDRFAYGARYQAVSLLQLMLRGASKQVRRQAGRTIREVFYRWRTRRKVA